MGYYQNGNTSVRVGRPCGAKQTSQRLFFGNDRKGCQVVQLGDLRIACAWPPFADAREITIVRPVAKLSLSDYDLDERLIERLSNHHRGVFICGRPGSGKTTLAQAIAEYLDNDLDAPWSRQWKRLETCN